jgi:hypothetical protein
MRTHEQLPDGFTSLTAPVLSFQPVVREVTRTPRAQAILDQPAADIHQLADALAYAIGHPGEFLPELQRETADGHRVRVIAGILEKWGLPASDVTVKAVTVELYAPNPCVWRDAWTGPGGPFPESVESWRARGLARVLAPHFPWYGMQ